MAEDTTRRREIAARAFAARRGELGLTQEQVAARGSVAVKTVQSFESRTQPRWPHARSRARLEKAVEWPAGQIERLAREPEPEVDPKLVELANQLSDDDKEALIRILRHLLQSPDEGPDQPAALSG